MRVVGRAVNPVLARELTERFRSPRAAILLSVYLALIGAVVVLVYRAESGVSDFGPAPVTRLAGVGQTLFETTLVGTMILVLFLVPGFSAGSISGERERQTLLPLQVTLMRPRSILFGKIASSVAFSMVLVVATMPLLALSYMIGGILLADIVRAVAMLLFAALTVAIVSVACSAWMRKVQTSTVVAYGIVLVAAVGTLAAFAIAREIDGSRGGDTIDPPSVILAANPLVALADVAGNDPYGSEAFDQFGNNIGNDGPLSALRDFTVPDVFGGDFGFMEENGRMVPVDQFGRPISDDGSGGMRLWLQHLLVAGGVSVVLLFVAARRLRTPARTER